MQFSIISSLQRKQQVSEHIYLSKAIRGLNNVTNATIVARKHIDLNKLDEAFLCCFIYKCLENLTLSFFFLEEEAQLSLCYKSIQ